MRVFLDTGSWIALGVENDKNHSPAKEYFKELMKKRAIMYTSDYVLVEAYTRLIYDVHLKAAQKLNERIRAAVEKRQLSVLEIGQIERDKAWRYLEKFSGHELSFTDATVVVNFEELGLDKIFTFDRHFRDINLATNLD